MDRTEKREFVTSLADVFAQTSMVVVTQNKGMTVAEVTVLRTRMRAAGATFKVAKNRLATLALDGTRFDGIKPMLKGPTALAWSHDPVAVAKVAVEFAKTNEKLVIIGGALGTQTLECGWDQGARRTAEPGRVAREDPGAARSTSDSDRRRAAGTGWATRSCPWCLCQEGWRNSHRPREWGGGSSLTPVKKAEPGMPSSGIGLAWNRPDYHLGTIQNG